MSEAPANGKPPRPDAPIQHGTAIRLSDRVWRITASNAGAMTGPGTNSYIVGSPGAWAVIDPGPADGRHLQALIGATDGSLRHILVTHTHQDHSPGAMPLKSATAAPLAGRVTLHPHWQDSTFRPDRELRDGERIVIGDSATLRVIHTPGHASNHLCYLLEEERILFTGDHIIQGSTVVIDPPDGDMRAYLDSLQSLLREDLQYLAPGHGTLISNPRAAIRSLIQHRMRREAKVLASLAREQPMTLAALVQRAYDDVPPHLHPLAERSLLAHLLKLQNESRALRIADSWTAPS